MLFHKRCFSSPHQLISAIRVIYVRANFGRAKGCTAWYSCNKIFWPNRLQIDLRKRKPNLPLLCYFGFYTCWQLYYNQKWKWGQKIVEKVLLHCVKSVLIQSYSGPYSVHMWKNLDQNNSEFVHFSPSVCFCWCIKNSLIYFAVLLHSF